MKYFRFGVFGKMIEVSISSRKEFNEDMALIEQSKETPDYIM